MSIIQGPAMQGSSRGFYPYEIDQSLRFEDGDTPYLTFDPAADGDRQNWSLSFWFKRGNLGLQQLLFGQGTSGSNNLAWVYIDAADELTVADYGGSYTFRYVTNQKFRDPSAWYHLAISYQAGDATASDRLRIWLNGERITSFSISTDPSLNANTAHFNTGSPQYISKFIDQASSYLDGYMAEVHFVDGTAYDADTFGELKSGIWIPKSPSVTYGTNGFYLDFANSADIGNDVSGNNNDWTVNNLVASDVVSDSPTNNFNVMNPALYVAGNNCTYSEGNLKVTRNVTNYETVHSTMAVPSGKWYWEVYISSTNHMIGVCDPNSDVGEVVSVYTRAGLWNLQDNGDIYANGAAVDTTYRGTITFASTDVLMVALDADNGKVFIGKNGTWFNSGDPAAGTGNLFSSVSTDSGFIAPSSTFQTGSAYQHFNFGQDDTFAGTITAGGNSDGNGLGSFKYTVPSGYLALCTSNLPDPAIDPAQEDVASNYFGTLIWSGDDNASRTIADGSSGVTGEAGFTPDFSWIKRRNGASNGSDNMLLDAVRGVGTFNALTSNGPSPTGTRAEGYTLAGSLWVNFGDIASYTTGGFTVQKGSDPSHTLEGINQSGGTYVGWNWKLGGAPTVDNSAGVGAIPTAGSVKVDGSDYGSALAGSIAATRLSANTTSGCSIVTYTGTGSDGTVAHGLSQAPDMLVFRRRDGDGTDHLVYHSALGADKNLRHNNTDQVGTNTSFFQNTAPTTTVFSIGSASLNTSSRTFVVYCFHSVEGFSRFGSFVGNGNANGAFVYTGFQPAFVLFKKTNVTTASWAIRDNTRYTYNPTRNTLYADKTDAEYTGTAHDIDFLSNGFKARTTDGLFNASGATYIYMAFAENPFKYSNAR